MNSQLEIITGGETEMEEGLQKAQVQAAPLRWSEEQVGLIKRQCAKGATDDEFLMFMHFCKSSGVDPLRGQAHFIVRTWKDKAGQPRRETTMMVGIDGMRSRAEQQADFLGITSAAVREGDEFSIDFGAGVVAHRAKFPRKGQILGAWSRVLRRDRDPHVVWVDHAEYFQGFNPIWKEKPEIMIVKTAEATNLRHEYPEPFSTTYEPAEFGRQIVGGEVVEPESDEEVVEIEKAFDSNTAREASAGENSPIGRDGEKALYQWAGENHIPRPHLFNSAVKHCHVKALHELKAVQVEWLKKHLAGSAAALPAQEPPQQAQDQAVSAETAPGTTSEPGDNPDSPLDPEDAARQEIAENWEDHLAQGVDPAEIYGSLIQVDIASTRKATLQERWDKAKTAQSKREVLRELSVAALDVLHLPF